MAKKKTQDQQDALLIGYARVSTVDQNLEAQKNALRNFGVLEENIYVEKVSATSKKRPARDEAFARLREGNKLVIYKVDRLARSVKDMYDVVGFLDDIGASLVSITESIDLSTPSGRLGFNMLSSFAQFERDQISQRTAAGLAAAMASGRKFGRKPVMTDEKRAKAHKLLLEGKSTKEVAESLKIKQGLIYKYFRIEKDDKGVVWITEKEV